MPIRATRESSGLGVDHVGRLDNAAASGARYDRCRAAGAGGDGRADVTAAEATARRGMCGGGRGGRAMCMPAARRLRSAPARRRQPEVSAGGGEGGTGAEAGSFPRPAGARHPAPLFLAPPPPGGIHAGGPSPPAARGPERRSRGGASLYTTRRPRQGVDSGGRRGRMACCNRGCPQRGGGA